MSVILTKRDSGLIDYSLLGYPTDGSFSDGAVVISATGLVADAVDDLNEYLGNLTTNLITNDTVISGSTLKDSLEWLYYNKVDYEFGFNTISGTGIIYAGTFYGDGSNLTGIVTDHSLLTNLDYASSGHTGFAPTSHTHVENDITNLDKYTQSEITTISGDIVSQIPTSHTELSDIGSNTHDQIDTHISDTTIHFTEGSIDKYTQAEVDALVASASGTTDHSLLDNLDYASSGHTGFQPAGDYITETEFTTLSGDIVAQIPSTEDFISTSQLITTSGDIVAQIPVLDEYITYSEIITISGDIVSQIPSAYTDEMAQDAVGNIMIGAGTVSVIYNDVGGIITISGVTSSGGGAPTDHASLVNLDYASSGHTGFQPAGDYTTSTTLTTISGDIVSQIPSDFYTQSEITTISGDIVNQIPIDYISDIEITTISGDIISQIITNHNNLSNLDYASSGHTGFQPSGDYIINSQFVTASGDIVSQIPSLTGYATENFVTTISGDLQIQIPTDYYTQLEVNNLVSSASGTTDHSELDNLDYASSGHTGFQPSGDYVTDTEMITISGDIINQIPSLGDYITSTQLITTSGDIVSQIPSDFDDRYYTETEINNTLLGYISDSEMTTISGDIVSQIPTDYYTIDEVDTISGVLSNEIDSDISTHSFDSSAHHIRYTDEESQDAVGNIMYGAGTVVVTYDDDFGTITISGVTSSGGSAPSNHSDLYNLDYASSGHTGFQPAGDYITSTQLTTISGDIVSQIPSDFYTTSEVDALTWTEDDITDLDKYTQAEVTTISGDIVSQIPFDFDDRYYTQSEVTTISGDITSDPRYNGGNLGILSVPTLTDNEDGTIGLTSVDVLIRDNDDYTSTMYKFTVPANNSLLLNNDSINYIYVDYNSGSPIYKATTDRGVLNDSNRQPVYRIYERDNEVEYDMHYGNVGYDTPMKNFDRVMRTRGIGGVERESGLSISESPTRIVNTTAGYVWFGLRRMELEAANMTASGVTSEIWYHTAGVWGEHDITQYDNTYYDNGTDRVALTSNRYCVNWVFRKADNHEIDIVLGEGDYTLAQAEASQVPDLPSQITNFYVLLGRIIVQKGDDTAYSIENVSNTVFTQAAVSIHNELSGLQGGTAGAYYHLTGTQHTDLTDGGDTTLHTHDSRYYTETEVNNLLTNYTTDSEITTISGDIVAQIPVDYVSDLEITTISGDLQTQIDNKSDLGHTHDDRYYTETEIDNFDFLLTSEFVTASGDIVSQIPTDYIKQDGSVALTSDWDIGDGRKISTDKIAARDSAGLYLVDDGDNGIFIKDGGNVGIGSSDPTETLQLGLAAGTPGNIKLSTNDHVGVLYSSGALLLGYNVKAPQTTSSTPIVAVTNGTIGYDYIKVGYNDGITFHTYVGSVVADAEAENQVMQISTGGNVGIGIAPSYKLHVNEDVTNESATRIYVKGDVSSTTNGTYYNIGISNTITDYTASGVTNSGYVMGSDNIGYLRNVGTIANTYGGRFTTGNYGTNTGHISTAQGLEARVLNTNGTIDNGTGVRVSSVAASIAIGISTGTIVGATTGYGVYIDDVSAPTAYGIYQAGTDDTNYFGGNVGIGTTTPSATLEVSSADAIKLKLNRPASASNVVIQTSNFDGDIYFGMDSSERFAIGSTADLGGAPSFSVNVTNSLVTIGRSGEDGTITLMGGGTGNTQGGMIQLHTADDYDGTISYYQINPYEDDLYIGPDTDLDALKLDSNKDLYITAGSLVLPNSEYVNFSGTQGASGYGIRDNVGTIEYKNSGGDWQSITTITDYVSDSEMTTISGDIVAQIGEGSSAVDKIYEGDTSVEVIDAGIGRIEMTVDNSLVMTVSGTGITVSSGVAVTVITQLIIPTSQPENLVNGSIWID